MPTTRFGPLRIEPLSQAHLPAIEAIQNDAPMASQWPVNSYLLYDAYVATQNRDPRGFVVVRHLGDSESEILNLAVSPQARRQGIGRRLLEHAFSQVDNAADRHWYLEVRESNRPAIELYSSLGFGLSGRRPNYYSNPNEAAIVMSKQS